ncbi:MAG: AAA family ATPase [Anaerolineae bacterium]
MLEHFEEIKSHIVAREQEIKNILATLDAGKHLILEGAPGTTKSTILRTVTEVANIPFFIVEGNIDLTPSKLVGHFNPSKVMADDYRRDYFEKGPLTHAMEGGILYIEEFNRVPADTANVLITAVEEGELAVPRYGVVRAGSEFRVVCAQNPYDDVGTMRLSRAIYDRFCRISLGYQGEPEEREIVRQKTDVPDERLVRIAVRVARETRRHREIKQGASVRGAMDMVAITQVLQRGLKPSSDDQPLPRVDEVEVLRPAMMSAMSGKIWLDETTERTPEEILEEILRNVLGRPEFKEEEPEPDTPDGEGHEDDGDGSEANNSKKEQRDDVDEQSADQQPDGAATRSSRDAGARWSSGWIGGTEREITKQLKQLVRSRPEEAIDYLHSHREFARQILSSPDVLDLYGYISRDLDPELQEIARRYASRLIVQMASKIAGLGVKSGRLRQMQAGFESDEIEVDATLERMIDYPTKPLEENLVVLARPPEQKACVVMLDHSNSMTGTKIAMAALTAAVIALHFRQNYGVVAFSTRAWTLKRLSMRKSPTQIAGEILSLQAHGYTNIRAALEMGIGEIRNADKKIGILITDGDWTYGGDPFQAARLFDSLHVIGCQEPLIFEDTYDEFTYYQRRKSYHGMKIASLAREGRGRFSWVEGTEDVPAAISRCLTATG